MATPHPGTTTTSANDAAATIESLKRQVNISFMGRKNAEASKRKFAADANKLRKMVRHTETVAISAEMEMKDAFLCAEAMEEDNVQLKFLLQEQERRAETAEAKANKQESRAETAETKAKEMTLTAQKATAAVQASSNASAVHNAINRAERAEQKAQQANERLTRLNAVANTAVTRAKKAEDLAKDAEERKKEADDIMQQANKHVEEMTETLMKAKQEFAMFSGDNGAGADKERIKELEDMLKATKEEIKAANNRTEAAAAMARRAEARAASGSAPIQIADDGSISSDDEQPKRNTKDQWMMKYNQLRDHKIAYGNLKVTHEPKLSNWINNQRHVYRESKKNNKPYCPEKAALLEGLGLDWGKDMPKTPTWNQNFEALKAYKRTHGNCNIPAGATTPLAKWVTVQRIEYKRHKKQTGSLLTLNQIEQLNEVGFSWRRPR